MKNVLSIVAIVISLLSLYLAYSANKNTERFNYLHVEPAVALSLNYPKEQPATVIIKNLSPIEIVSLGVTYKYFIFDKDTATLKRAIQYKDNSQDFAGEYWLFADEVLPNRYCSQGVITGPAALNEIQVLLFDLSYYRKTDMKKYQLEEYFFIEDGTVLPHAEFRKKNKDYRKIMAALNAQHFAEGNQLDGVTKDEWFNVVEKRKKGLITDDEALEEIKKIYTKQKLK